MIKFVVVEEELTLLLSRKAAEKMKLITVNYDKFQSVSGGGGRGGAGLKTSTIPHKIFLVQCVAYQKGYPLNYGVKLKRI